MRIIPAMLGLCSFCLIGLSANSATVAEQHFEQKMQSRFNEKHITKSIVFFDELPQEQEYEKVILFSHVYTENDNASVYVRRSLIEKVNPEVLADRVLRYQFGMNSLRKAPQGTSTIPVNKDENAMRARVMGEILKSPDQAELDKILRTVAEQELKETKNKIQTEPSFSENIMKAINDASISTGYGHFQKNPHPESIDVGYNVGLGMRVHPGALIPGITGTKYEDALYVDLRAGYIQFQPLTEVGLSTRTSQIYTIGANLGPFSLYGRQRNEDFAATPEANATNDPRFKRYFAETAGFRFNFRNEKNPHDRSYAFIDYESYKFSDKPFEANVIKETATLHPNWPMVKLLHPNAGLLLGYLLSVGYVADLSNQFPVLIPALGKIFSRPVLTLEAVLRGSAMGQDDPDSIIILAGFKIKMYDRFYIGVQFTYGSDLTGDPLRFVAPSEQGMNPRDSLKTMMVMIEFPLVDEKDGDPTKKYTPFRGPQKLVVQKFENFAKIYQGPLNSKNRVALFPNSDERDQKIIQGGYNIDLAYQRFLFKNVLSYVHGKNTELSAPNTGTGYAALESQIHYRLTKSSSVYAKLLSEGKFTELGIGFEFTPLKTERAEVKLYYEREPYSNFPCLIRPNQIVGRPIPDCSFRAGFTAGYDLLKLKFFTAALSLNFNVYGENAMTPKMVDWRIGAKIKSRFITVELPINNNCFSLGDSNGKDPHAKGGEGKGGGKCESYTLVMIDVLEIYRALTGTTPEEIPEIEVSAEEMPVKLVKEQKPDPSEKLANYARGQEESVKLLSDIGYWLKTNPKEPDAEIMLDKVSQIIENLAKHYLFIGKYYYDHPERPSFISASEKFRQILQLFDSETDFDKNTINDEHISNTLKYFFSHPGYKPYLQRYRDEVVPETMFCLSQTYKKQGKLDESHQVLAELKTKYPNFDSDPGLFKRFIGNFKTEHQCYGGVF